MKHVFYKGPPFKFDHTGSDHDKFISCVRFAPDGSVYATAGLDGRVAIYQGENGHFVVVHQLGSPICAIDFSPDSKQIMAAQMDGRVVIIDVASGAVVAEWAIGREVFQQQAGVLWTKRNKISVSLNGDFNFLGDRGAFTVDRGHTGSVMAVAPLPGGFVSGDANGTVLFWRYGAKPYAVFGTEGGTGVLPGIRGIATTSEGKVAVGREDGRILILNPADGSQVASYVAGQKQTGKLVAGTGFVATYSEKNLVILVGSQVKSFPLNYVPLAIALAPDGREIAIGGADKIVHLYDVSGAPKGEITGLFKEATAVAYSLNGTKIAATSEGKEISVWDRRDIANPIIDGGMRMHSLAVTQILWLPDSVGFVTVSKDRSIRVWSSAFKRKAYELPRAHEGQINDAFWVDAQTLLTAGQDGSVRTWTVAGIQ
jgi:WD40 repeat protein